MTASSAVTRNVVKSHELAAARLDQEASRLRAVVSESRGQSYRGRSLYSAPGSRAAGYLVDDLERVVQTLVLAARAHRKQIEVFWRVPCPACRTCQSAHCGDCGSCPGRGWGPSCAELGCGSLVENPVY